MVYPYSGIVFSSKKKELSSYHETWRNLRHLLLSERAVLKGYMVNDSKYLTLYKQQNSADSKQTTGYQGFGGGRRAGGL